MPIIDIERAYTCVYLNASLTLLLRHHIATPMIRVTRVRGEGGNEDSMMTFYQCVCVCVCV